MEPGVPGPNFILVIGPVAMDTEIDIENVIVLHRLVEEEIATDLQPIVREDAIHRFVQVCFNCVSVNVYSALVTSLFGFTIVEEQRHIGRHNCGCLRQQSSVAFKTADKSHFNYYLALYSTLEIAIKNLNFLQVSYTGKTISFQAVVIIDISN